MNKTHGVVALAIYFLKATLEKYGRTGARVNAGVVFKDGEWQIHHHFSTWNNPCTCLTCQPKQLLKEGY